MRAPFQVLVFPYELTNGGSIRYAVFRRSDMRACWQGIAGGGEGGESPGEAAARETFEEAGISGASFVRLDSCAMLPVEKVCGYLWGPEVRAIPEYCFGVKVNSAAIKLSREHDEFLWLDYDGALRKLTWESNRNALRELHLRLSSGLKRR